MLVPALIEYTAKIASQRNVGEVSETELLVMDEIWKAFTAILGSVADTQSE
jgi:hypothetical protein